MRVGDQFDLDPLQESFQLVPDVSGPLHAAVLDVVLVAPLRREVGVCPLGVDVEEGQVVAARHKKVLPGRVGVNDLILWPVKDGRVVGKHGGHR